LDAPISFVTFEGESGAYPTRVIFFTGDRPSGFTGATHVTLVRGDLALRGHLKSRTAERTEFDIDEGLFAGGSFIVMTNPPFGVELVTFGSGVPVVKRERGIMSTPL
jgi:hypothetical protein